MSTTTLADYVRDHRFHDRPLLPGVLSLEMLLASANQAIGSPVGRLRNLAFFRPAWAGEDGTLRTRIRCRQRPQGLLCHLDTAPPDAPPDHWHEHAAVTVESQAVESPPPLDLAAILGRCTHEVEADDLYRRLAGYGLHYGPSLRAVRRLVHNETEVLADLCVPTTGEDEAAQCRLHPSLLDASLQALACLVPEGMDETSGPYLPFAADEVRVHAPVQGRAYSYGHVAIDREAGRFTAEVTLVDTAGRVLVELRGLSARRVPPQLMEILRPSLAPAPLSTPPPAPVAPAVDPSAPQISRPVWRPSSLTADGTASSGPVAVFLDEAGVGEAIARGMTEGRVVARVSPGPEFRDLGEGRFELPPDDPQDLAQLWRALQATGEAPAEIIDCRPCDAGLASGRDLAASLRDGFFSIAHTVRTLREAGVGPKLTLRLVTADSQAVTPQDACDRPMGALAWGLARVLDIEYRPWRVQCLDVPLAEVGPERAAALLRPDLGVVPEDAEVTFRAGARLTPTTEPVSQADLDGPTLLKPGGLYVIIGGLGGIGLAFAEWLARRGPGSRLVLVGRTPLPTDAANAPTHQRRREAIARLEALGAQVDVVATDVADEEAARQLIADAAARHGRIDAVFHAAGVLRDGLLQRKDLAEAWDVFRPKVAAALALDAARGDVPLVLFSSVVGWLGNVGQADYAAANRFLDSFAAHCAARGRPTRSIAWGPWAEVGMAAGLETILKARGIEMLRPAPALDALDWALRSPAVQLSIVASPEALRRALAPSPRPGAIQPASRLSVGDVQDYLARRVAAFLQVDVEHIAPDARFQDFGIDSISAVQMLHQLETSTGLSLPPTLLFDHTDLASLAGYLHETVPHDQLEALLRDHPVPDSIQATVAALPPVSPPLAPVAAETQRPPVAPVLAPPPPVAALAESPSTPPAGTDLAGGAPDYATSVRPLLAQRMKALRLDKCYTRALGDYLEYEEDGRRVPVLDMLGGFGSTLFGHNHPDLVRTLSAALLGGVPSHAQASLRGASGRLARRLSALIGATTGRDYVAVFANSGAEAIEAALKHSWMEHRERIDAWRRRQRQADAVLLHAWKGRSGRLPDDLRQALATVAGLEDAASADLPSLMLALWRRNDAVLEASPRFLAVRRSFHGKTAGALRLTYNPEYQVGSVPEAPEVTFIHPTDVADLREAVGRATRSLLTLAEDGRGGLTLKRWTWCGVAAAFVEPVQGEGGVRPLDPRLLGELRDLADRHGFPLVVDEVQSGMGRCGSFTASEGLGLRGDYYALGKALGGGLAKIAALLIERRRYVEEFGVVHTSTFAEDDPGALVALEALDLLDRDGLPARCAAWGAEVFEGLRQLRREFPEVIADVRGTGCLIGVELAEQSHSPSALLRQSGPFLGLLASSYLLNVHQVRVLPTSSSPLTLRLEPSAYVSREDGQRCLVALRQCCLIISRANAGRLVRHLVCPDGADPFGPVADWSNRPVPEDVRPEPGEPTVAFFSYFIEPADVLWWEPSLAEVPRERHGDLVERFSRVTPAGVARRQRVRSVTGGTVLAEMVGFLVTSDHLAEALKADDTAWLRRQIDEQLDRAVREGVQVVGFGGFLSIVTHNAVWAARSDIGLTTGNALTVSTGMELWREGCRDRGIDLVTGRVAVVGAYGNIGSTYARLVAEEARRLLLVGRSRSRPRLRELAAQLIEDAWGRLLAADGRPAAGVAGELLRSEAVRARLLAGGPLNAGEAAELFARVEEELGENGPFLVSDDLRDLRRCQAILTASNAPEPIIQSWHLADGPVVICDVAVPTDVARSVARERPDVLVISGGETRLPLGQRPALCGRHLPPGSVYACLAETLLLGLAGWKGHFSFGPITRENVHAIGDLARQHGFDPAMPTAGDWEGGA